MYSSESVTYYILSEFEPEQAIPVFNDSYVFSTEMLEIINGGYMYANRLKEIKGIRWYPGC